MTLLFPILKMNVFIFPALFFIAQGLCCHEWLFALQLGAYVIHTIQSDWPTAIQDIISMFDPGTVSGLEPSIALNLLFNILTVIPEEVSV